MVIVLTKIWQTLVSVVYYILCGMIITYIAHLRGRVVKIVEENLLLIDRMHEGLIVMTEHDKTLQFATKPAVNLLK